MERQSIDIGIMVREEFEGAVLAAGVFEVADASAAQATVRLEVDRLGMHRGMEWGFSERPDLKPIIGITAVLADASGNVLWKQREVTTNLSGKTPAYPYEDYLAEPERIREVFGAAIELTVADLIDELQDDP